MPTPKVDLNIWPFMISEGSVNAQVKEGKGRKATLDERYQWVADNLTNVAAEPRHAPDNSSWVMLRVAMIEDAEGGNGSGKFLAGPYHRLMMKQSEAEDSVSRRQVIKNLALLSALSEPLICDKCKGEMKLD